jgi:signal peptidase I
MQRSNQLSQATLPCALHFTICIKHSPCFFAKINTQAVHMKSSKLFSAFLDLIEVTFIGVAVFVIVYLFIGQPLEITGTSMEPTLANGEMIIAEKMTSRLDKLERGDIVVFKQPENKNVFVIKRIVGLPGDEITLTKDSVYINGTALNEDYVKTHQILVGKEQETINVATNSYFLMGDNRSNSTDSRKWGPIDEQDIVGKAVIVFSPFEKARLIESDFSIETLKAKVLGIAQASEK